jgi:general secretion pathway protein L
MTITMDPAHSPRFFGLNLALFWRDLRAAWGEMLEWRIVSWLWPKLSVRLWTPDGAQLLVLDLHAEPIHDEARAKGARFDAVLLPQDLLLRRTLTLPALQPPELQSALTLEVQAMSPFAPEDTCWVYEQLGQELGAAAVDLVLTSRKLIQTHLAARHPGLALLSTEVWVERANGRGYMALPGFGDERRQRQGGRWRWVSAAMFMLTVALAASIALTPSVQLYMRSLQARQALGAMQQKAGPALAQRAALLRDTEQLDKLLQNVGKPIPTLQTINLITQTLPDDTSLLTLKIQGLKVSISGQTPNTAALMKQLGATPGMKDVKAPSAATKPPGATRESFVIEFLLDPGKLGGSAP